MAKPPTIDLTATEVESVAPAGGSAHASSNASAEAQSAGTKSSAPPPRGPGLWERLSGRLPSWRIIGAVAGAVVLVIIAGAMWWTGMFVQRSPDSDALARMARLEAKLNDLSARPAPASDAKVLNDVTSRLAKIESALAAPSATAPATKNATDEIVALRAQVEELAAVARAAQSRADAAANTAEAAQKSSQSATAEAARAARADDKASRNAVAASALRATIERSEPFVAELAAARALAADAKDLGALEVFAAKGIPSTSQMARELAAIVPAMLRANSAAGPDASILDKLQANAERLVRVRPVGNAMGDDPTSIIARVDARAAQSDIEGALSEMMKLPPAVRAPAEGWIKVAEQRNAAIATGRQFARDALAALGNPAL